MATNPDQPPSGRPIEGSSWSERVRHARRSEPPAIDVQERVRTAIAREQGGANCAAAEDGWSVFAAIFAGPRVLIPGVACTLLGAPCALWLLVAKFGQLEAWARFMVIGGLPPWLAALVT